MSLLGVVAWFLNTDYKSGRTLMEESLALFREMGDRSYRPYLLVNLGLVQGAVGDKFYLIRSGRVSVLQDGAAGRAEVTTLGEGDFFGERALVTGELRNTTIVAAGPVELYALGKDAFRAALDSSPTFKEELLKVFFNRSR